MKANVYSHETLIGTTILKVGDESMGCMYGDFIPNKNYRPPTRKYDWNSLRLNLELENGYFLFAAGGICIEDNDSSNRWQRIDVVGIDRIVFDEFFGQQQLPSFIKQPWSTISVKQKIAFEDELFKEIGILNQKKSFFSFLNLKSRKHELSQYDISALCHDRRNDDVLFVTREIDSEKQFAVVHLTWKGEKEIEGYPNITFYDDFEQFKFLRMEPDTKEWD